MLSRRMVLAGTAACLGSHACARPPTHRLSREYATFLAGIRRAASAQGVRDATLDKAFRGLNTPNQDVIARDRNQPEFTMTWLDYRAKIITDARLNLARQNYLANQRLLHRISESYRVDAGEIVAIWGLESSFGSETGKFNVIDALASLAYEGRRRTFFRAELIAALKILDRSGFAASKMRGSYAGAMGQPQFMPSAYLRYAVNDQGGRRADIWSSEPDIFASIANFLAHSGWRYREPWGYEVTLQRDLPAGMIGRGYRATDTRWAASGITLRDGRPIRPLDLDASVLQPDGSNGSGSPPSFMVYDNFNAIRRYNPSDFYALGVGLIADAATMA